MEINSKDIRVIITASGATFVGQELDGPMTLNKVKLTYPFRFLIDQAAGITSVAAPVFREEWIVIDMTGAIECALNKTIEELYVKYCNQIFSGIILPEEKRIII